MRSRTISLLAFVLSGCAANSGVVSIGQDLFRVSRQAATGFSGSGNRKTEALAEASQHRAGEGKRVFVTNTIEAQPPYILGNYPKAEVHFTRVNAWRSASNFSITKVLKPEQADADDIVLGTNIRKLMAIAPMIAEKWNSAVAFKLPKLSA